MDCFFSPSYRLSFSQCPIMYPPVPFPVLSRPSPVRNTYPLQAVNWQQLSVVAMWRRHFFEFLDWQQMVYRAQVTSPTASAFVCTAQGVVWLDFAQSISFFSYFWAVYGVPLNSMTLWFSCWPRRIQCSAQCIFFSLFTFLSDELLADEHTNVHLCAATRSTRTRE